MKRNALSVIFFGAIVLMFSACGGSVNNGNASDSVGVQEELGEEQVTFTSADRKTFGLKGDVKECKGNSFGDLRFDEQGRLCGIEGIEVKYTGDGNDSGEVYFGPTKLYDFAKGVMSDYFKRDENGLLTLLVADPTGFAFTYDDSGFCSEMETGDGQMIVFKSHGLDADGKPASGEFNIVDDMGENVSEVTYEYTKFDDKGNWTERTKTITKETYKSWETEETSVSTPNVSEVEKRVITYYE